MLYESSRSLRDMPDYVSMLYDLSRNLGQLPDWIDSLRRAIAELQVSAIDAAVDRISGASSELANNVTRVEDVTMMALHASADPTPDRLTYLLRGAAAGALIVAVVVTFIFIYLR